MYVLIMYNTEGKEIYRYGFSSLWEAERKAEVQAGWTNGYGSHEIKKI